MPAAQPATVTAEPREQPLVDWVRDLFDRDEEKTRKRRAALRATWEEMRDFLVGVHETLVEQIQAEGGDLEEAADHVLDTYLSLVVEQLAEKADDRLDWKRIEKPVIRAWLEEHDGAFIRRLFFVARNVAAFKRKRQVGSRLLTLLPGPVHPRRAPSSPVIIQRGSGTIEGDATEAEPDPPAEGSARSGRRRLEALQDDDHRATGRTPADLPRRD